MDFSLLQVPKRIRASGVGLVIPFTVVEGDQQYIDDISLLVNVLVNERKYVSGGSVA